MRDEFQQHDFDPRSRCGILESAIELEQRCYCLSNSNAKTASTDRRIATTDSSKVAAEGSQFTESGSIAVGSGKFQESGAIDLSGSKANNLGIQATGNSGNVNIVTSDPEILQAAIAKVGELTTQYQGSLSEVVSAANSRAAASEQSVIAALADLAETKQSDGVSDLQKTFLLFVLLIALLIGVLAWRKKR